MGILQFFKSKSLSDSKLAKLIKTAIDPYVSAEDRDEALQRLAQDGSLGAIRGLVQRFTSTATGHIADEKEKKWVEDRLVQMGETALEPLRDYIQTGKRLTYALRAFQRIAGREATVVLCLDVLERLGPDDHRNTDAKLQLVQHLTDEPLHTEQLQRLMPFMNDHSDDVRWSILALVDTLNATVLEPGLHQAIAGQLGHAIMDTRTGPRIHLRAAEVAAQGEWPMPDDLASLGPDLEGTYFLDKKRYVRKLISPARANP